MTTKLINRESSKIKRELIFRTQSINIGYSNQYPTKLKRRWSSIYFSSFLSPVILVQSPLKERNPLNLLK